MKTTVLVLLALHSAFAVFAHPAAAQDIPRDLRAQRAVAAAPVAAASKDHRSKGLRQRIGQGGLVLARTPGLKVAPQFRRDRAGFKFSVAF